MLNISKNRINKYVNRENYPTLKKVENQSANNVFLRIIGGALILLIIILILPWTQNIRSIGNVTTLKPEHRPQTIHSIIPGRIEKWFVQEGDFVKKGDTIAFITEVKDAYFDPNLLDRTANQKQFKEQSVASYNAKIEAVESQINMLSNQRKLKLEQTRIKLSQAALKVKNDSTSLIAFDNAYNTAKEQYDRAKELYEQGLKSLTDIENRNVKMQDSFAKKVAAENKFLASKQEYIAAKIELSNIQLKFDADLAKLNSDKYSSESAKFDTEIAVNKLENQVTNYAVRRSYQYILAPQDCFITKLIANGIGEVLKEGAPLLSIMPATYELAAEIYIDPIDLPLVHIGESVRIQFDGWPAIVFSGWPNASSGTYGGLIYGIDQYLSPNGKYRILIRQDPNDEPWPNALRFGGGANAMLLLDDVPIYYELWRKINGFPPNYYKSDMDKTAAKK
ncbi:HlyD family secretion protein [Crocinitomix algicola]|uniref:HlyD family secretion protein n=1 Tax=Crocinitomix algicola TaxID=1740263 RepID=UPI00087341DC|nr:HlyD family efflux transporter periplasmic adaptor subunit [Crocinitomix algicola]